MKAFAKVAVHLIRADKLSLVNLRLHPALCLLQNPKMALLFEKPVLVGPLLLITLPATTQSHEHPYSTLLAYRPFAHQPSWPNCPPTLWKDLLQVLVMPVDGQDILAHGDAATSDVIDIKPDGVAVKMEGLERPRAGLCYDLSLVKIPDFDGRDRDGFVDLEYDVYVLVFLGLGSRA
ncbi:hypothetical protein MCOR21_006650 [Pyricularia oryzae]|nr:hypothetical protein MCOR21_006650 [Pyricularia oryzae]KAI6596497.1 hypothetical protein MCOR06_002485 [Pyricularia oryzae]